MSSDEILRKRTWRTADFEEMGWHDVRVHAFALTDSWELLLDIDYIVKWVEPKTGETFYSFWTAPATLVFQNVYDLHLDIAPFSTFDIFSLERADLRPMRDGFHDPTAKDWLWTIEFTYGLAEFRSTGFEQVIRDEPRLTPTQHLTLEDRGGFSFARESSSPS